MTEKLKSQKVIDLISSYLQHPTQQNYERICGISLNVEEKMRYFLTFLGCCFIEGYKILEKIDKNIFILSRYQFNTIFQKQENNIQYKLIYLVNEFIKDQYKTCQILLSCRRIISHLYGECLINILSLNTQKITVINLKEEKLDPKINTKYFFQHFSCFKNQKKYCQIGRKQQGILLHLAMQHLFKGNGYFEFQNSFSQIFGQKSQIKFKYDLNKLYWTIMLIIAKQILENDYVIISSQKWMRKRSERVFKRFDLLLRNQQKTCIIDWKFSQIQAQIKIKTNYFFRKNQMYYQLANKDYGSNITLKFYCIHKQAQKRHFLTFTESKYKYQVQNVNLDFIAQEFSDSDEEIVFEKIKKINQSKVQCSKFVEVQKQKNEHIENFLKKYKMKESQNKKQTFNQEKTIENSQQNPNINSSTKQTIIQTQQIQEENPSILQKDPAALKKKIKKFKRTLKLKSYIQILSSQDEI